MGEILAHRETTFQVSTITGTLPGEVHEGGMDGDKGLISVHDNQFILHAYFVDRNEIVGNASVRIEFFESTGRENALDTEANCEEFSGYIEIDDLKATLCLLNNGQSPVEYLKEHLKSDGGHPLE